MEKIIVAIRTLNDNLKIVATRVEDLEKRIDTIEARIDGIGSSLTDSIRKVSDDTQARLAELTERVYSLENNTPAPSTPDDVGDALDDIVGMASGETTVAEVAPTPTPAPAPTPTPAPAPTPTTDVEEEKPTMCPNVDDFIAECLGQTTTPTVAPTPAPKPTKTKAVVASAVQRRAYARQYMVERGAKVEDLRSPAKIEEVMETEEFKKWAASTILMK